MIDIAIDKKSSVSVIHLRGSFFSTAVDSVRLAWSSAISDETKIVAFDCSELTSIDSSAIGTLVHFFNKAMHDSLELVFFDLSPAAERLFAAARLNSFFTIMTRDEFEKDLFPAADTSNSV